MKLERDTPEFTVTTGRAQWEFFRILNRLEPRVLQTLHDEPLHLFRQARASLTGYDWATLKEWTQHHAPEEPDLVETSEAIEAWAKDWNLLEPWVLKSAYNTLEMWRSGSTRMEFGPNGFHVPTATPLHSRDIFPEQIAEHLQKSNFIGWEPTDGSAEAWKQRLLSLTEKFADEHISTQEKIADRRGYPSAPAKRKLELHLVWLVQYQVLGMSHHDIAYEYLEKSGKGFTDDAFSKALSRTAKLISLSLRDPGAGGRPIKTPDTDPYAAVS